MNHMNGSNPPVVSPSESDSEPVAVTYNSNVDPSSELGVYTIVPSARDTVTAMAPDGYRCVITHAQSNLERARILRRAMDPQLQRKLATSWGIEPKDLGIDAPENRMWLTPNMHTAFDKSQWILLPPYGLLHDIAARNLVGQVHGPGEEFTQLFPHKSDWEYTFVQLIPCPDPIMRLDNLNGAYTTHSSPYDTVPTIISHVHPYYVICNVAQKDREHNYDATRSGQYTTFSSSSDLGDRITLCRVVYQMWLEDKPDALTHSAIPTEPIIGSPCSDVSDVSDTDARLEAEMSQLFKT